MSQRTCEIPGCERKHLARGMCSTHYNRQAGESVRHPKVAAACAACGKVVLRHKDSRKQYSTTCSVACRTTVQWGETLAQASAYAWQADAIKRAQRYGVAIIDRFDREEIFDRDGWTCQLCGIRCSSPDPYALTSATVDHVVPMIQGGPHSRVNAQTACLSCNARKSDRQAA